MTAFAVFALALTFVYLVYYGFLVSRDLTRRSIPNESNVECIDVGNFAQTEKPEAVRSIGDGFQVGDGPVYQPDPLPDVISLDGDGNPKAEGINAVLDCEHLLHKAGETQELCEDISPSYEVKLPSDEYSRRMESHQLFPQEASDKDTSPAVERIYRERI